MFQEKANGAGVFLLSISMAMAKWIFIFQQQSNQARNREEIFYTLTKAMIKTEFLVLKIWRLNMGWMILLSQQWLLSSIMIMTGTWICTSPLIKSNLNLTQTLFGQS